MFTVIAAPQHVVPMKSDMPTWIDQLGGGALQARRKQTRALQSWELDCPGKQIDLDSLLGLLQYAQGDKPLWFDLAGFYELTSPVPVGEGDGVTTDFALPHRHVFVASTIIYINGAPINTWTPLGNGIEMDSIRFASAPASLAQISATYRRKAKVLVDTEQSGLQIERAFRSANSNSDSVHHIKVTLKEIAV